MIQHYWNLLSGRKFARTHWFTHILLKELGFLGKTKFKKHNVQTDIASIYKIPMRGIIQMTSLGDLINILKNTDHNVSFQGTGHTMGGHTLINNGILFDTKAFNKVLDVNTAKRTVTVQPGIIWSDLIVFLNKFGMSPQIIQSYSGFSVGGSLFAHGILCDYNIAHSIKGLKILLPNGKCYDVTPGEKLFEYIIGTYGTCGFIYEITLNIVPNDKLKFIDNVIIKSSEGFKTFKEMISELSSTEEQQKTETEIKFIRMEHNLETMKLHKYVHAGNVASELGGNAPTLSWTNTVIFHWFAHWEIFKQLKKMGENLKGIHLDAVYTAGYERLVDRNVFAYEGQESVSGKLSYLDATHVLQEYFLPFVGDLPYEFVAKLKNEFNEKFGCDLLNVTARIVKKDEYPFVLSYCPKEHMCAFVLYIRLGCDDESIEKLKRKQISLNQFCVENGGTFYLPYLHHYTKEQLLKAYPRILEFIKFKQQIDPSCRFTNEWYNDVVIMLRDELGNFDCEINVEKIIEESKEINQLTEVSENYIFNRFGKRTTIIQEMTANKFASNKFKLFLDHVFPLYKSEEIMDMLSRNSSLTDKDMYFNCLLPLYRSKTRNPFNIPGFISNARNSLKIQLKEIESQIVSITNTIQLDNFNVGSILNVGDKGRYNDVYKKIFPNSTRSFVTIDWSPSEQRGMWIKGMIDEQLGSAKRKHDIIFSLAGLHHYKLDDLEKVLEHCKKTISIGGYFILRDHDVTNETDCNMVDNAHLIFNGLTGESHMLEINEMRYLRSRKGWEKLMKEYGFESSYDIVSEGDIGPQLVKISAVQKHDPTRNIMMCFKYVGTKEELISQTVKQNSNKKSNVFQTIFFPITFLLMLIMSFFGLFKKNTQIVSNEHSELTEIKQKFKDAGGRIKPNFDSVAQIPEWYNVLYAEKYPELLIDYPWYLFPFMKAYRQMIDVCKFAYDVEKQNGTKFSSDVVMSLFVITCHCVGCVFSSLFATLINSCLNAQDVGGVRHILVENPKKADLNTEITFRNTKYKSKVFKEWENVTSMVEVPMYRPFTEIVKVWFENDKDITIKLISGNDKVWVDVRGKIPIQEKWPAKTIPGLLKDEECVNYLNVNVSELRELFEFAESNNAHVMQIFQQ